MYCILSFNYIAILLTQMLWREFFYFCSYVTPSFDKMEVRTVSYKCALEYVNDITYYLLLQCSCKFLGVPNSILQCTASYIMVINKT